MGMSEMNHAERVKERAGWEVNDTSQVGGGGSGKRTYDSKSV
jgi:hypothetical protein